MNLLFLKLIRQPYFALKNFLKHSKNSTHRILNRETIRAEFIEISLIKYALIFGVVILIGYWLAIMEHNGHYMIVDKLFTYLIKPNIIFILLMLGFFLLCIFHKINTYYQSFCEFTGLIFELILKRINFAKISIAFIMICGLFDSYFVSLFFICHETNYFLLLYITIMINLATFVAFVDVYLFGIIIQDLIDYLDTNTSRNSSNAEYRKILKQVKN